MLFRGFAMFVRMRDFVRGAFGTMRGRGAGFVMRRGARRSIVLREHRRGDREEQNEDEAAH
jgi:hypothetical protein